METEINIGRQGSRKENIVAPPVSPTMIATNGTIQHSRETKTVRTAKAIELLKVVIREKFKGDGFPPPLFYFFFSQQLAVPFV